MEVTVTDKEEAIERLNKAIIQLSGEAEQTKVQMERVQRWSRSFSSLFRSTALVRTDLLHHG